MTSLKILDESAPLEAVVLGNPKSNGAIPTIEKAYDPKSKENIKAGTYPREKELIEEIDSVEKVLNKYGVKVYSPKVINDYNQVFVRDIAFVVDEKLIVPCVTHERKKESDGIQHIIDKFNPAQILYPDENLFMEGGDIILWKDHLFVGYSEKSDFDDFIVSRTNRASLDYLTTTFPDWVVKGFELIKSDDNPRANVLHLDCCFQPIGDGKAIIYAGGFKNKKDVKYLIDFFGKENVFELSQEESYHLQSNLFSINRNTLISDKSYHRLNTQLKEWGFTVEEVSYVNVARMGGAFRCSTLPLRRKYD